MKLFELKIFREQTSNPEAPKNGEAREITELRKDIVDITSDLEKKRLTTDETKKVENLLTKFNLDDFKKAYENADSQQKNIIEHLLSVTTLPDGQLADKLKSIKEAIDALEVAEATSELENLLKFADNGDKKALSDNLTNSLREHYPVILNQAYLKIKEDDSSSAANGGQNSGRSEKIVDIVEGTKVDKSVRGRQVELVGLMDDFRQQLSSLKDDVLKSTIVSQIEQLFNNGEYQKAITTAVQLANESNDLDVKGLCFSNIKGILSSEKVVFPLYIDNQKITQWNCGKWIKKMNENLDSVRRMQDSRNFTDVNTNYWSLDKKGGKQLSEKKAMKQQDEELADILKYVNPSVAQSFIDTHYDEIKSFSSIDEKFTSEYLLSNGYIPKEGNAISKKELTAMKNLFYFKWNYYERTYGAGEAPENWDKTKLEKQKVYDEVKEAKVAGLSISSFEQAKSGMEAITNRTQNPHEALKLLFGDANRDGRILNVSETNSKRKNVDQGTIFGGQIAEYYHDAIIVETERKVIGNIESVISKLHGLEDFKVEPKTERALVEAFKQRPAALLAFRNKLFSEADQGHSMFNQGVSYVDTRIDAIKSEQEMQSAIKDFVETNLENEALKELDSKIQSEQMKDLRQVRENLDKIKGTDEYKNNQDFKNGIDNISTWLENDQKMSELLNTPVMKDYRKAIMVSGLGASFMTLSHQGETYNMGGLGASFTSEKLNDILARSKVFDHLNANTSLFTDGSHFSLGLGLSLGGSHEIGRRGRVFYDATFGWTPTNPDRAGLMGTVGYEHNTNLNRVEGDLGGRAAIYLGVSASYGAGIDLSSGKFDTGTISAQAWWRKDKLAGVEKLSNVYQAKMTPLLKDLFSSKDEITVEGIVNKLRDKDRFPTTLSGDVVYQAAVNLLNMFNSYKESVGGLNDDALNMLCADLSRQLAQDHRNKDIERIVKEGLHISQVGVGYSMSPKFADGFIGMFVTGSFVLTKYDNARYQEDQGSFERAMEGMVHPEAFRTIQNKEGTIAGKLDIVDRLLNADYLNYVDGDQKHITLNKDVFKNVRVYCSQKLAPHIVADGDVFELPANADISVAKILHQGKSEQILILGETSINGCKEVEMGDNQALKWTDSTEKTEFGTDKLDNYNLKTELVAKETDIQLDGRANEDLISYLANNGDVLVNFRQQGSKYKQFVDFMKSHSERNDDAIRGAVALLPDSIKSILSEWKADDIRYVYASLSRVSQTRDKQLEGDALGDKANTYLSKIRLSSENKAKMEGYIGKVKEGDVLSDDEWNNMKNILGIRGNGWGKAFADTPNEKLFHILTPVKKLAETRTSAYETRIKSEYHGDFSEGANSLIEARNRALQQLEGKQTAVAGVDDGKVKLYKGVGAVAGYDLANEINDKFVSGPKIIEGSEVEIKDKDDLVVKHFLEELANTDWTQFNYIRESIIAELRKGGEKDQKAATELEGFGQAPVGAKEFIDKILSLKSVDANGRETNEPKIKVEMKYGFFAECVNETILLSNIKVNLLTTRQIPAGSDVKYYESGVTSNASTRARNYGIGGGYGWTKSNTEPDVPGDRTEPDVPEDRTEPFSDADLGNADSVDFNNITLKDADGNVYNVVKQDGVYYASDLNGDLFVVGKNSNTGETIFIPLKDFQGFGSNLDGADPVEFDSTLPTGDGNGVGADLDWNKRRVPLGVLQQTLMDRFNRIKGKQQN